MLDGYTRVHLALFHCYRAQWDAASQLLEELQSDRDVFTEADMEPLPSLIQYLMGVIYQGSGKINAALSVFQGPAFDPNADFCREPSNSSQRTQRDLVILATLNTILIVRCNQSKYKDLDVRHLISSIEPLCTPTSSHKAIQAALNFIRASSNDGQAILKTKEYIGQALTAAQSLENTQLKCMTLALVSGKFLRGVVGEQAEKGARAALMQANKTHNNLWISVTQAMYADALEVQGKMAEARAMKEEASRLTESIMPGI